MSSQLVHLQNLLYRLITAPNGVEEALAHERELDDKGLEAIVGGIPRLSADKCVGIYANAYFYRLLDVFKEDFPCTSIVLGDIDFHNLITGYLIEYPPTEPSLFHAGRRLADHLKRSKRAEKLVAKMPFLADLVLLERARVEVFHGIDAEALDQRTLRYLAPDAWPDLRMRMHPAAQLLDLDWRVDALIATIEAGCWQIPPEQASATILVWRREFRVHYRPLESGERAALKAAASASDFASICAAFANELETIDDVANLPATINRMLAGWLHDQIMIAAEGS